MSGSVHVAFTKFDGGAHWEHDSLYLGEDAFGHWIGCPTGQFLSRPGKRMTLGFPGVMLAPHGAQFVATFNADAPAGVRAACEVYVDVTSPVRWNADRSAVTMVDLDLDVLRLWDGRVVVDDEDEFAEHRISLGYPDDVVRAAERSCAQLVASLRAGAEPFASVFRGWLAQID